jgi:hypothetical protein
LPSNGRISASTAPAESSIRAAPSWGRDSPEHNIGVGNSGRRGDVDRHGALAGRQRVGALAAVLETEQHAGAEFLLRFADRVARLVLEVGDEGIVR